MIFQPGNGFAFPPAIQPAVDLKQDPHGCDCTVDYSASQLSSHPGGYGAKAEGGVSVKKVKEIGR